MSDQQNQIQTNTTDIAVLKVQFNEMKIHEEDHRKNNERWQDQQDKRLDKLEAVDDIFQRDATISEKQKFSIWIVAVTSLATTIIGAVVTLLLSKF